MIIDINEAMLKINKKPLKKELRLIAKEVTAKVRALLQDSNPSGRMYGSHQASAPGQPPSLIDGALAQAITYKIKGSKITITDSAYYSLFLEQGSVHTGKSHKGTLLSRPFMSVVLDEMRENITERITKAVMMGITSDKENT